MKKQVFAFVWFLFLFQLNISPTFAAPVINEFSSADSSDWIEIYNSGGETVDLSLYRFRDLTANNKLDLSGNLNPGSFAVFDWSNKLNNGGDLIKLVLSSDESIIDQISYGDQGGVSAPGPGQTAGRRQDGGGEWVLFISASKNSSNNSVSTFAPPTPTPSKTPTPTKSPTPTKTPTAAKTSSSGISKTPTPKIATSGNNVTSKTTGSTNIANSAKITTYSKPASQFAAIKSLEEEKKKEEVKVLGTKDSDFSLLPVAFGLLLILSACALFVRRNLDQIRLWIKK